jgi:hypothetical protein
MIHPVGNRAPLHEHIPRLEMHDGLVHLHVDFPRHDRVINAVGPEVLLGCVLWHHTTTDIYHASPQPIRTSIMSLRPQPLEPVPEDTARVARAAFPKGNPYLTLRDQLRYGNDSPLCAAGHNGDYVHFRIR